MRSRIPHPTRLALSLGQLCLLASLLACEKKQVDDEPVELGSAQEPPTKPTDAPAVASRPEPEDDGPCREMCARSMELACGTTEERCIAECRAPLAEKTCRAELLAAYGCFAAQPKSAWECDQGIASIRDGHCDDEQRRFAECLSRR